MKILIKKTAEFLSIAEVQIVASDIEGAKVTIERVLKVVETIEDSLYKVIPLIFIAQAQALGLEDIKGAKVTIQEALEIANEIEDSDQKIFTLRFIADMQPTLD